MVFNKNNSFAASVDGADERRQQSSAVASQLAAITVLQNIVLTEASQPPCNQVVDWDTISDDYLQLAYGGHQQRQMQVDLPELDVSAHDFGSQADRGLEAKMATAMRVGSEIDANRPRLDTPVSVSNMETETDVNNTGRRDMANDLSEFLIIRAPSDEVVVIDSSGDEFDNKTSKQSSQMSLPKRERKAKATKKTSRSSTLSKSKSSKKSKKTTKTKMAAASDDSELLKILKETSLPEQIHASAKPTNVGRRAEQVEMPLLQRLDTLHVPVPVVPQLEVGYSNAASPGPRDERADNLADVFSQDGESVITKFLNYFRQLKRTRSDQERDVEGGVAEMRMRRTDLEQALATRERLQEELRRLEESIPIKRDALRDAEDQLRTKRIAFDITEEKLFAINQEMEH